MFSQFSNVLACGFVIFLCINLLVGLLTSRGVGGMRGFATGNYSIGTGTLTITLIATMIGSRYIGVLIFDATLYGIIDYVYQTVGLMISGMLMSWFVLPRLFRFKHSYTLGHIMGELYGGGAQVLTGVLSVVFSLVFLVGQVVWLSHLDDLLGLRAWQIVLITGVTVTLYTLLGGIRSVSGTDVLQFFCIVVGVSVMACRVVYVVGDGGGIVSFVERMRLGRAKNFDVSWHHEGFWPTLTAAFYVSLYPMLFLTPPVLQRICMARGAVKMRGSFLGLICFYPIMRVAMAIIGFGLLHYGATDVRVEAHALPLVMRYFFADDVVAQVCIVLMMVSVVMSTIDSFLNATVVVILEDVVRPMRVRLGGGDGRMFCMTFPGS